jgi:N-acetylneuraminic acid mutarotase
MKKFLFLLLLTFGAVWTYFWYVRGENLFDRSPQNLAQRTYAYAVKKGDIPHWEVATPMLSPRVNIGAAAVGDKIYVIGGQDAYGQTVATVEAFNVKTNEWSRVADLPHPLHHVAAASDGSKVYVFGGLEGLGQTPVRSVYAFDPTTGTWEEGPAMKLSLGAAAVTFVAGKFHVLGGVGVGQSSQLHLTYDPVTKAWGEGEPLVSGRDHFVADVLDGKIFVAGGRAGELIYNLNDVEAIYPASLSWEQRAAMPVKRSSVGSAYIGGTWYVFGGEAPTVAFSDMYAYDPRADKWKVSVAMPTARHGFGYATVAGRIYVFGGGRRPGFSVSDVSEVFTPAQ